MQPTPVTDFRITTIEMTAEQYHSLPQPVQDYLRMVATEHPQGMGKPVILEMPIYHIAELERLCRECGMQYLLGK